LGRIGTLGIDLGEHAVQSRNLGNGRSAARSRRSTAALRSNRSNRFVLVRISRSRFIAEGLNDNKCEESIPCSLTGTSTFSEFRKRENKTLSVVPLNGWALLSALDTDSGTSPVMAHDENPHDIANDTKQKMIGEALQVHAAEITLADHEGFRPLGGLLHVISQLGVKFVGEFATRNPLVISHKSRRYPKRLSDVGRGASGSAALNLLIKLLQREAGGWIRFELGIAPKRLGYALVLVVEDRWKRIKQVSCKNGPVVFRQILSEFLDLSDRGHGMIIVGSHLDASESRLVVGRTRRLL
jgi:hypothetical protein